LAYPARIGAGGWKVRRSAGGLPSIERLCPPLGIGNTVLRMKSARSLPAAITAVLVLAVLGAPAASAQSPLPGSTAGRLGDLEVELVDFPVSVGPADSLTVGLEVTNSGNTAAGELEVA